MYFDKLTDHPNINQFSETIYLQRYEYFKFFAESYFHDSFWKDILKREKKSTNKLIAFFYIINHKCQTDKSETSRITYKSLKKFIGNEYTLNEFINIFDDCHLGSGSISMFVPFLKLGQKRIFKEFENDYMKFEIQTFNDAKMIGDEIIFQIPNLKKRKKINEKKLIENLQKFFGEFFKIENKKNPLVKKINFFDEIADTETKFSDNLLIIAFFYGVFLCFASKHSDDFETLDLDEFHNKIIALFMVAMTKHIPKKENDIFEFFQKVRLFGVLNPNWRDENLDGQYYLSDKCDEGYILYEEHYELNYN